MNHDSRSDGQQGIPPTEPQRFREFLLTEGPAYTQRRVRQLRHRCAFGRGPVIQGVPFHRLIQGRRLGERRERQLEYRFQYVRDFLTQDVRDTGQVEMTLRNLSYFHLPRFQLPSKRWYA